jgi:hypothetical protein
LLLFLQKKKILLFFENERGLSLHVAVANKSHIDPVASNLYTLRAIRGLVVPFAKADIVDAELEALRGQRNGKIPCRGDLEKLRFSRVGWVSPRSFQE